MKSCQPLVTSLRTADPNQPCGRIRPNLVWALVGTVLSYLLNSKHATLTPAAKELAFVQLPEVMFANQFSGERSAADCTSTADSGVVGIARNSQKSLRRD